MYIIEKRKIFFGISGTLMVVSLFLILALGLNFGIDFKGGSLTEISYPGGRPDLLIIKENIRTLDLGEFVIQGTGERGVLIKTRELRENEHNLLITALSNNGEFIVSEERFTSIGPVIGRELRKRAIISISLVIVLIIIFIAYVFRKVSHPVRSWKYGVVAIIALFHDILIPTGLFAILGKVTGAEVDTLFVTALLAILGLSVNDTIVVFDRIRENLRLKISKDFSETVGVSLRQTITRSINTSLTTLFVLLTLLFFGPESTRNFALVLSVGLVAGTYSSIFLASPLLVMIEERGR